MQSFIKEYESKTISAENAAKLVKSDDWVDFGMGASASRTILTRLWLRG